MLAAPLILAVFAAACLPAASALAAARWPRRSPAVAIVLWQALGLGWGLAAVGALAGLGAADTQSSVARGAFALASRVLDTNSAAADRTRGLLAGILGLRLLALMAGLGPVPPALLDPGRGHGRRAARPPAAAGAAEPAGPR